MTVDENDRWISAVSAVESIGARLGVGLKQSRKILAEARASSEVRQSPGGSGPVHSGPSGLTYMYGNDVNLADLKYWLDDFYPVALKTKKILGLEPLKKWLLINVNQTRSETEWRDAALRAHPGHRILRGRWREAWSSVPDMQKLPRGRPGR